MIRKPVRGNTLEPGLRDLHKLTALTLSLGRFQLRDDTVVGGLVSLKRLSFRTTVFLDPGLPRALSALTALTQLHLWHCGIKNLPRWFSELRSLEVLRLQDSVVTTGVPCCMTRMTRLRRIACSMQAYRRRASEPPLVFAMGGSAEVLLEATCDEDNAAPAAAGGSTGGGGRAADWGYDAANHDQAPLTVRYWADPFRTEFHVCGVGVVAADRVRRMVRVWCDRVTSFLRMRLTSDVGNDE